MHSACIYFTHSIWQVHQGTGVILLSRSECLLSLDWTRNKLLSWQKNTTYTWLLMGKKLQFPRGSSIKRISLFILFFHSFSQVLPQTMLMFIINGNGTPTFPRTLASQALVFCSVTVFLSPSTFVSIKIELLKGYRNMRWFQIESNSCFFTLCRRISMAGLSSKTVPHLADAIHAAVTRVVWFFCWPSETLEGLSPHRGTLSHFAILL